MPYIKIGTRRIPIREALQHTITNPLLNTQGSLSLPLTFSSYSPVVRQAFGFPNAIVAPGTRQFEGKVNIGIRELDGSFTLNQGSRSEIEAYFNSGSGHFYSAIQDKYLIDLEYGGVKYPAGQSATISQVLSHMTVVIGATYPDKEYTAFMAYMPKAEGENTPSGRELINPVDVNETTGNPYFIQPASGEWNSAVYLFVGTVLQYIFYEHGYRIGKNIIATDPDLSRMVVFNTYNRIGPNLAAFDYSKLVPRILVSDFLKALEEMNIGFLFNDSSRVVDIVRVDDVIATEIPESIDFSMPSPIVFPRDPGGFDFAYSQADEWSSGDYDTADEFLPYGTLYTVDKLRDITANAINLGKYYFVKSLSAYYTIEADYEASPTTYSVVRVSPDQFPYSVGKAENQIGRTGKTLAMFDLEEEIEYEYTYPGHTEPTTLTTTKHWLLPRCDLEGNKDGRPYTDFPLIFLLSWGSQSCDIEPSDGISNHLYPLASCDIYDALGSAVSGAGLALKWHGDYGIIEKLWKKRIYWEQYIKRTVKGALIGNDIHKLLDFSGPVRIGEHNYLVNSVELEISGKRIDISEVELYTI